MLKQEAIQAMEAFTSLAKAEFDHFVDNAADQEYIDAAQLILDAQAKGGRVHITGIGKPGHVSGYGASLMSSTGTPTYFLHGTEAVHGSCGQLAAGDVVICISNSGETAEMKTTVTAIKRNGCKVIGITGNRTSWLARKAMRTCSPVCGRRAARSTARRAHRSLQRHLSSSG